jgi:hypothetical protein
MRLIDVDKLEITKLAEFKDEYGDAVPVYGVEAEDIANAPTVDAIVPPVKVGQTVWYLNTRYLMTMNRNTLYKAMINRIYIEKNNSIILSVLIKNDFGTIEHSSIKDIGKTVFLTREAAEAALKAREKQ